MGGRELIGEGNTITYTVKLSRADIVCVGVHCPSAPVQRDMTDINHFRLAVPQEPTVSGAQVPLIQLYSLSGNFIRANLPSCLRK